jgi:TolB-like protein/DNA-binding winged helix-turn-helix (wHTH) protein/Tfp pilus assembly protein PilF
MDESTRRYRFDEFTLDLDRACLLRDGERLNLRPKAFDTLKYLVLHRGRVATKEELVEALWPSVIVTDDSLIKCIQEVRAALADHEHRYIETISRRGYLFDAAVMTEGAAPLEAAELPGAAPAAAAGAPTRRRAGLAAVAALGIAALAIGFVANDWLAKTPTPAQGVTPPTKSVAVLPFVTIGNDPGEEYFSDGVSEELLNVLANVPGLHVPSRTSSFTFKQRNTGLRTIGNALNVDYVLEGSVRKAGARVRITAQLIDVATDSHLWSATYDREITDVFAIQDEIAASVAEALQIELLGAPRATARTANIAAYDAYLLGTHYSRRRRLDDNVLVRQSFARAIELDPKFAAAHAGLALAFLTAHNNGLMDRDVALAEAGQAVARALELDSTLALGYVARGWIARNRADDTAADADLARAIDLQPGLAEAYFQRMFALSALGRFAEARASLEHALELDPLNGYYNRWMGNVQLALGEFEHAAIYDRRAIEFEPSQANAYAGLGDIAIMTGHLDDGLVSYLKGIREDPGHAHITALIGMLYVSLGDDERARLWFDKAAGMYQVQSVARLLRDFIPVAAPSEDPATLLALVRDVPASQFIPLGSRTFRKAVLQTGDLDGIEAFQRQHWPELFAAEPRVSGNNFGAAPDVAWLLLQRGETYRATRLLELALAVIHDPQERTIEPPEWSVAIAETETLALLGRKADALASLRRAVDTGWRVEWWQVQIDPTLVTLRNDAEFVALLAEVKTDLARQLERIRAMERTGELDGTPRHAAAR